MINARQHTQALFIYSMLHGVLNGCYKHNPEKNTKSLEDRIREVKTAELDRKKSDKNMIRAMRLTRQLIDDDAVGENGLKIILAVNYLFQGLINDGYEIFQPDEYAYELFVELLGLIDPDKELGFDKKNRKAEVLAAKWRETLTKEGYFL